MNLTRIHIEPAISDRRARARRIPGPKRRVTGSRILYSFYKLTVRIGYLKDTIPGLRLQPLEIGKDIPELPFFIPFCDRVGSIVPWIFRRDCQKFATVALVGNLKRRDFVKVQRYKSGRCPEFYQDAHTAILP